MDEAKKVELEVELAGIINNAQLKGFYGEISIHCHNGEARRIETRQITNVSDLPNVPKQVQ